jgi:hypothetical protein
MDGLAKQIPLLTPDQCREWVSRILDLRPCWLSHWDPPRYTLGASSYDMNKGKEAIIVYIQHRNAYNRLLRETFGDLYRQLLDCLEVCYDHKCMLAEQLGHPTVHIFEGDSIPGGVMKPHRHCDAHFHNPFFASKLGADWARIQDLPQFSFTLPLRLPSGGGGMNIWDLSLADYARYEAEGRDVSEIADSYTKHAILYREGTLITHAGLYLHEIMPVDTIRDGDIRITMQGHGALINDVYKLFW